MTWSEILSIVSKEPFLPSLVAPEDRILLIVLFDPVISLNLLLTVR